MQCTVHFPTILSIARSVVLQGNVVSTLLENEKKCL